MFDFMVKENSLLKYFKEWNLNEIDLIFIKEMIVGCPQTNGLVISLLY